VDGLDDLAESLTAADFALAKTLVVYVVLGDGRFDCVQVAAFEDGDDRVRSRRGVGRLSRC